MEKKPAPRKLKIVSKKKVRGLGVFSSNGKVYFYFHSSSDPISQFHVAQSSDGFSFTLIKKAQSKDLFSSEYERIIIASNQKGVIVPNYRHKRKVVMYSSDTSIFLYSSKDLIYWEKNEKELLTPRKNFFDSGNLAVEGVLNTEKGLLLIYHSKVKNIHFVGVALFDFNDPTHLLWRCLEPIWIQPKEWRRKKVSFIGVILHEGNIIAYWQLVEGIYAVTYGLYKKSDGHSSKDVSLKLKRAAHNPLITPNSKNAWESFNTFNPAAVYDDEKVHILYRAQGYDYMSVLGYAVSHDGIHIDERLDQPVYVPSQSFENISHTKPLHVANRYISGGGFGGCEDPRITKIDNRYYLTYVAFDGANPPRITLTSISVDNFLNRRFLWERPVLISPPGVVDKSAVIFPEKINGKYVIMHRIYPDILIDFEDSLNFDGTYWLKGEFKISPRQDKWDSRKIGAGAPPLRTKYGWLLIYQSVGEQDPGRYKIGAMLLHLSDPTKVLCRSQSPILEPEQSYENDGFKAGVIYPCGAVIIDKTLYVYYGAADSYVCVATANLEEFLQELRYSQIARLTTPTIEKIF